MFILPAEVYKLPVYAGLFNFGPVEEPSLMDSYARRTACPKRVQRRPTRSNASRLRANETFSMRLSLWGPELFPTVRTKYTKADRVNDDLLANVDDTVYCDFWYSNNFTAYVADYQFRAFDSACFLEKYTDNFTVYLK